MRLGRTLGMPTANLLPEADKLLPPNGVYYARVGSGAKISRLHLLCQIPAHELLRLSGRRLRIQREFDQHIHPHLPEDAPFLFRCRKRTSCCRRTVSTMRESS